MEYYYVDVFSNKVLSGNGLVVVFIDDRHIETQILLKLAQEFKQFETIFLKQKESHVFEARIFTVEEELEFAGHPILGAAASVHEHFFKGEEQVEIRFKLAAKEVSTFSKRQETSYSVTMNQGSASYIGEIKEGEEEVLRALGLKKENKSQKLPLEVISTGLPYLIVPLQSGLEECKIQGPGLESLLDKHGAKFVYVFDEKTLEARTWDNLGKVEDVATGSAAGPLCAYLIKHKLFSINQEIAIKQGGFVGRPSILKTWMVAEEEDKGEIMLEGEVAFLAEGKIRELF